MKKRLRSPAVLLVAFAMVIATAGVVYAHWSSTSRIEANVNVGNMQIGWTAWATNDDGDQFNDPSGYDNPAWMGEWNPLWNETSLDPADPFDLTDRYDKNVGSCYIDGDDFTLNVQIDGAYPSYHCNIFAEAFNHGSVPAMATALRLTAEKSAENCTLHDNEAFTGINLFDFFNDEGAGQFVDFDMDGYTAGDYYVFSDDMGNWWNEYDDTLYQNCPWNTITPVPTGIEGEFMFSDDLTLNIYPGIYCGTQIDPGPRAEDGTPLDGIPVGAWIHVENGMEQGVQYRISLEQDWINWNEFDETGADCTFNGIPIGLPTP